jgi:signal transduction histidine kinase
MMHENKVVGVAIILVDVTRLRQADELKSGLVSTVSHELRTPLTSLRMSTNLLLDSNVGPLTPNQRKLAEAARDESERLYRIIENLLNFSRAQAGATRIRQRSTPVVMLINDALEPLRAGFEEKRIRLTVSCDQVPDASADPPLAASVIGNLLSNALKFTPAGGRVEINARQDADNILISVNDSGPGVAPEHVSSLFQRFFRARGNEGPPGTGLGLAIAREIAIAHGGSLSYAPHSGGGSSFRFTIPIADSSHRAPVAQKQ